MKKINNFLIFITIFLSIFSLIFITKTDIYGFFIKLTIIPVLFIPKIFRKILKMNISQGLELAFLIYIFAAQYLGTIIDLYHKVYFYDTLMHFLSGFLVSVVATDILLHFNVYSKKHLLFNCLFILGFSYMIAGSWEFIEFTGDKLFGHDAQNVLTTGVDDTMKDMIVAVLATILYCIIYLYEITNNKKILIAKYIERR